MAKSPAEVAKLISAEIARVTSDLATADMLELGHAAMNIILLRTKSGKDADLAPFAPYGKEYAETRARRGLSTTPDLSVKGHMLGAMNPVSDSPSQVTIRFVNPLEERKAETHNFGSNHTSLVSSHTRSVYVSAKSGQRASYDEIKRDARRKNKKLTSRTEQVGMHKRHTGMPAREFMDVRAPAELAVLQAILSERLQARASRK